ncbi:phosphoribulokinase [Rhodomicrobium sp. Az07]|uniref:phosphoribulokinase n=1 Tax=Rhodomicrobium sp. Az07 TaxID=2839034 RepID=UPI001BE907F1|nr:phosphoribulokinase [Rhodomicrobium sp. Az07]MBT3069679.1 phosphoribulokinase [Rhodomicrobium sp. Az07]
MSAKYPIISVTGSSGAGTSTVKHTFEQIFRRENIKAAFIEGDAFHLHDRASMKKAVAEEEARGNFHLSHFGPDANLLKELENTFSSYGKTGTGKTRHYVHDEAEAQKYGAPAGTFTDWKDLPEGADILFYEGLHGAVILKDRGIDIASHADLKIGVVPVINLEWIQKMHRDAKVRGYSPEDVTKTILRRMPDYVHYITPQFSETDINFQRVPTVDTSNPFVARWIPTPDESLVVIRFKDPRGIDFAYLKTMIQDSFMSRANSIVIPGGKLDLAMQLILTPMIHRLVDLKRRSS